MYTTAALIINCISGAIKAEPPGGLCLTGGLMPAAWLSIRRQILPAALPGGIIGTIWARILACNRPLIAAGITLILAAVILRRIPRLSKEDWIINTRRTVTGLGILLIVLSFTAGDGSGFGIGSGDGIGIGDENSSGAQNVQEDPDPDGAKEGSDDPEQEAGAARTETGERPDRLPALSDTVTVIRVRGTEIYCQEQLCTAEELEKAVKTEYRDGMEILVQDDYADDITYSRVLQILDTYQITYGEEKL